MNSIRKLYDHMQWADRHLMERLRQKEAASRQDASEEIRLFAHLLAAEAVWLARLRGDKDIRLTIWPEIDLDGCEELLRQNESGWNSCLSGLAEADLDRTITYANSSGQVFANEVRDILLHVALHGHYHRGQINSRLRTGGTDPINIDYMMFMRLNGE